MQLLKNKKNRIVCILLLVALLAIIAIIIVHEINSSKEDAEGKRLVDTIGKDSGNVAKVYITNDQNLVIEFENAKHSNMTMSKSQLPVYNSMGSTNFSGDIITYEVKLYNKNTIPENVEPVSFPCECELEFVSNTFGRRYTVKLEVDDKIKYISGAMELKEVDKADIEGYSEYSNTYGDVKLPDNAVVLNYTNTPQIFALGGVTTTIDVGLCDYLYEGVERQMIVTKLENKELLYKIYCDEDSKKLKVNNVDVYVIKERGAYIACYTYRNMVYVNQSFCKASKDDDDNAIIEALKPYF